MSNDEQSESNDNPLVILPGTELASAAIKHAALIDDRSPDDHAARAFEALQRNAMALTQEALRFAIEAAETRGYERRETEEASAQDDRADALSRLGGAGLLDSLREARDACSEARDEANEAESEATTIDSNLGDIASHFESIDVDTSSLSGHEVPSTYDSFSDVEEWISERSGANLVSADDIDGDNINVDGVDFNAEDARQHAENAAQRAEKAEQILAALIKRLEATPEEDPAEEPGAGSNGSDRDAPHTMYAGA